MRITIDTALGTLLEEVDGEASSHDLYSRRAFEVLSEQWARVGWNLKYTYTFTWMGRPVVQLPEDLIRIQEVIYQVKPDAIIETGVAHGGSLVYYASLCMAMGRGRVIGVDVEIRPHNRRAIEEHELSSLISLIEGDSTAPQTVDRVRSLVYPGESVLVLLDSCHTKQHVLNELESYHDLVSPGSYIVVMDGIMRELYDVPRGRPEWRWDNPAEAAAEFAREHREFTLEGPARVFDESGGTPGVTHCPGAWLRRVRRSRPTEHGGRDAR